MNHVTTIIWLYFISIEMDVKAKIWKSYYLKNPIWCIIYWLHCIFELDFPFLAPNSLTLFVNHGFIMFSVSWKTTGHWNPIVSSIVGKTVGGLVNLISIAYSELDVVCIYPVRISQINILCIRTNSVLRKMN